ncbi:hypothetical protein CL656_05740 [bacterium]|nr:hypothetical protein [bacterium]
MKILWPHTYDPSKVNSGIFMHRHAKSLKDSGIDLTTLYLGKINNPIRLIRAINLLNKNIDRYDLIHPQYGSTCGLSCAFNKKIKIISLKGSDWYKYKTNNIGMNVHSKITTSITRSYLKNYDSIVVMSHAMRSSIQKEFDNLPPIHVISDPIDLNLFKSINPIDARKKFFNTKDESPWVLFVSSDINNPIKRYFLAKEAVSYARNFYPNLKLKVASEIPPELMPKYISCFNLVISTSLHEGWPNNIKEALALNIPFVSTNVSDLEGISLRNKYCFVTSPNPSSLGSSIIKCLSFKKEELKNLRNNISYMSMEETNKKYIKMYKKLIY